MDIKISQQLRPCIYNDGVNGDVHALLHFVYPKSWTHGAGATIGSAPAGQETHAAAAIELEDGRMLDARLYQIKMLDSEFEFKDREWPC